MAHICEFKLFPIFVRATKDWSSIIEILSSNQKLIWILLSTHVDSGTDFSSFTGVGLDKNAANDVVLMYIIA